MSLLLKFYLSVAKRKFIYVFFFQNWMEKIHRSIWFFNLLHNNSCIIIPISQTQQQQQQKRDLFCKSYYEEGTTHLNTIINWKAWTARHSPLYINTTHFRYHNISDDFKIPNHFMVFWFFFAVFVKFKFMIVTWRFILIQLIIVHYNNSS